jgi:hypothetical protein
MRIKMLKNAIMAIDDFVEDELLAHVPAGTLNLEGAN